MKLLGDNKKEYNSEETTKEFNRTLKHLGKYYPKLKETKAQIHIFGQEKPDDEKSFARFECADESWIVNFEYFAEELIGEIDVESGEDGVTYYNDNYDIEFRYSRDNLLIFFGVFGGFTQHEIRVAALCYMYANCEEYPYESAEKRHQKKYHKTMFGMGNDFFDSQKESQSRSLAKIQEKKEKSTKDEEESHGDGIKVDWSKPKSIVEFLDHYIIGQERAKKEAATTFSNFIIRRHLKDSRLPLDHCILIGSTGCGKTKIVNHLIKKSGIIRISVTASGKSSAGYHGGGVTSSIASKLKDKTDENSPHAVVFIDEVDKILCSQSKNSGFSEDIQDELIGLIGGTEIEAKETGGSTRLINTENLLFFFAGAFHKKNAEGKSLWDIIAEKGRPEKRSGFTGNVEKPPEHKMRDTIVEREDLIKYGAAPELIGRISGLATLDKLNNNELKKILTDAKDSVLEQYSLLLELRGYTLENKNNFLDFIVSKCPEETGARALREVTSNIFKEIIYSPEDFVTDGTKEIVLDAKVCRKIYGEVINSINDHSWDKISLSEYGDLNEM